MCSKILHMGFHVHFCWAVSARMLLLVRHSRPMLVSYCEVVISYLCLLCLWNTSTYPWACKIHSLHATQTLLLCITSICKILHRSNVANEINAKPQNYEMNVYSCSPKISGESHVMWLNPLSLLIIHVCAVFTVSLFVLTLELWAPALINL